MINDLIFTISKDKHTDEAVRSLLTNHPEIKFVSLIGVDLSGNATDEKIPVKLFLDDLDSFMHGVAIQTDGSSVVLPGIATLNNAKVDMIADLDCNWFIDYNFDHIDTETNKPIGTLRIPCFLYHDNKPVDSRYILSSAVKTFKEDLNNIFEANPEILTAHGISKADIDEIVITSATELEFWVNTPNDTAEIEELSTSQVLHEHYWNRTKGSVRTALEEVLLLLEKYDYEPEMGHKEVGGVKAKLDPSGNFNHIMEQLEIDWKFSDAVQTADNLSYAKIIVQETFRRYGLDVTFMAKPLDGVAGSGMHVHLGASLKLKNGKRINLFNSPEKGYLSTIGYGALMGILKNYEIMNPFISGTNNSLKRLRPGFEAPICIVTSLGVSPENPSRNRSILIGLIRDLASPAATRFELRSPNPHSNPYITIAVSYLAMLDGILYAANNKKTETELLAELSKEAGDPADYLEKGRAYRSEEDVFEHYNETERNRLFSKAPATVYENLTAIDKYPEKLRVIKRNSVMTDQIISSYKMGAIERWTTEIVHRVLNSFIDEVRACKALHSLDKALDLDVSNWMKIDELRHYLMKDSYTAKSLFSRIKKAFSEEDYPEASRLYLEAEAKMEILRDLYSSYKKNLLDI
jgi:glutamine synthetase